MFAGLLGFLLLGPGLSVQASAQDILIGHVAGYTGAVSKDANELGLGAKIYFDAVNARGGINGKMLRLVVADDNYKPEETTRLIASMAGKVSALLPPVGSANLNHTLKAGVLDNITLPIVGTIPSNESFRTPVRKNIFHFRAGDRRQLEKIIEQLTAVGITNIAVLARDNPSSTEGIAIIQDAMKERGLKLDAISIYDVSAKTFASQVKFMTDKKPDAIILLGTQAGIANVTKELKEGGVTSLLYAVSYADFKLIAKTVGPASRGFVISQVMPSLNNRTMPLVRAFREDFAKYSKLEEPAQYHLEGYVAGKLIVEAMRRSKDTSAEGVRRGLEQLRDFDLGGFVVDFSPTKHTGSNWVDLSMLSASGVLVY
jgi:branched-chain amino acid transport system substrate-binding protein